MWILMSSSRPRPALSASELLIRLAKGTTDDSHCSQALLQDESNPTNSPSTYQNARSCFLRQALDVRIDMEAQPTATLQES